MSFFAGPPGRFRHNEGIGQFMNDTGHLGTESLFDDVEGFLSSLIFDRIVQKRRNSTVLIAAALQHQGTNRE